MNYLADKPKVCWDAGHGGYDPGAVGNGLHEADLTLDIVMRGKPLAEYNGITVVLTRNGNYAPGHLEGNVNAELGERCRIANANKVDLMLSTHINAGGGTGQEILVQGAGGKAQVCADTILPFLVSAGAWYNRGVKVQNVEVLRDTNMPAILTESGFIDSVSDTNRLKDPNFRQALAVAHVKGMCAYFGLTYKTKGVISVNAVTTPVATKPVVADPDVYLSVRVRASKANALIAKIIADGFACKALPLA